MSGPESSSATEPAPGITWVSLPADIIELAPLRERTQVLKALAARRGLALPSAGWITAARETLVLCVRPERWLLLTAPNPPGAALAGWRTAGAGCAAAIELSSALTALYLAGPAVPDVLARGCRLDLHPQVFLPGSAAATYLAQVPVMLAALPAGWLLLTPSTTARHFGEWLGASARAFGFVSHPSVTLAALSGERTP